ncbi:MAG: PmoA family protein [Candidatus Hydrogenedentes bacterium]|nr:PmoA family protein [Candidatus Hydrogenedentota bacterium]
MEPVAVALSLWCVAIAAASSGPPLPAVEWDAGDGRLALQHNGQVIWQLNFGSDAPKPFFHPLAPAGGPALTWQAPPDHPWHHGLWFSWKYIDGVNFWEEDAGTGRSPGLTAWDPPQISTHPDGSAQVEFRLRYEPDPGRAVLSERRLLDISPPGPDGGFYIDWTSVFEALAPEVLLDRTPIAGEPDGKAWGGYAGLSVRFAPMADAEIRTDNGDVSMPGELADVDAEAVDYSGVVDGPPCGIAIIQFPGNPLSPTPWYLIARPDVPFHYFSPAVLYRAPRTLTRGKPFTLRYRIYVHPGRWTVQQLRDARAALSTGPAPAAPSEGGTP